MTHPFSDEFISAWLDDELNDSEAAKIQATIENDPDLARRVHELRLLSGIFKSLPVEPVPRGFKDLVVEATRTIVRDTSPASRAAAAHQTKTNPTYPTAQRWWFGVIGLVSTAALVLVTIDLTGERNNNPERSVAGTVAADSYPEKMDSVAMDSVAEIKSVNVADAGAGLPAPSTSFGDSIEVSDDNAGATAPPAYDVSQLTFDKPLKDADVGDVIQAIRQSGNEVTVVKLTVVDINASVNRLEVLLAAHEGAALRTGGMVMVEANYEQLADCFRHLQQEDLYQQMLVASRNIDAPQFGATNSSGQAPSIAMRKAKTAGVTRAKADRPLDSSKPVVENRATNADKQQESVVANDSAVGHKATDGDRDTAEEKVRQVRSKYPQKKPIRLLIVLEPALDNETNEGNGSIIEFQSVYGPIG
jgi:hypothetical protein